MYLYPAAHGEQFSLLTCPSHRDLRRSSGCLRPNHLSLGTRRIDSIVQACHEKRVRVHPLLR